MGIKVENLSYSYPGNQKRKPALENVSLEIARGEFAVISGTSGAGKSTLIKHFNGILTPESGRVTVDGLDTTSREVRRKVGMLFQHSQDQLFEETIYKEIAFGPSNFGIRGEELKERVHDALSFVHLDTRILNRSPFSLSGGEKRRVALAGIMALRPTYLVLDEPTAGLDPESRTKLLGRLQNIHKKGVGIIVVSHNMEEILPFAQKVISMEEGKIVFTGSPEEYLRVGHSPVSLLTRLIKELNRKGANLREDIFTAEEALKELQKLRPEKEREISEKIDGTVMQENV
ncbi:ATP-binding cassette domain-containing protein [Methanosarcina sp. UBA289]|uniref:ATP-binding cassette domain-containing protein n=1 Tax=Methanosarcina sp. UBA289 TaxID=1915574 RepID=UPI0025CD39A2|nr:ATP-binding cassette domain-containing protein [Methanosarcina sp. UBA289]